MLLKKEVEITIFEVSNDKFEQLGFIDQYTSLIWPDSYRGYATFELWAPITEENKNMIKEDNVIWCGGENAAVIEIIKEDVDEKGVKTYNVKGRTLEKYLCDRIIWGGYTRSGFTSEIMYDLVDKCAINPTNKSRKIPYLVNAVDKKIGKKIAQYQKTGGELYDALDSLASDSDLGFSVLFDPKNEKLIFEVRDGADRTENNVDGNDPVVFSTELEDILSSSYYMNKEDLKTVVFVQGEDSGDHRVSVQTGDVYGVGFERRELYVDARDLQSEIQNEDGSYMVLTPDQYASTLIQRGDDKLSEHTKTTVFEAKVRQFGDVQYEFGVDYIKGDKVTVIDEQLGISVSARITKAEENIDDEYELILTFGYSYPTVLQKIKRVGN